jgi:hypothetical protein
MCLVELLVEDGWLKTHQVLQVTRLVLLHFILLTADLGTIWIVCNVD